MRPILTVEGLTKRYKGGPVALDGADLEIRDGEILALLGPNGAGKTTLISLICGLVSPTGGTITVDGHDALNEFRAARRLIGLVPQEISLEPFETVGNTVRFSRGLFGLRPDPERIETILRQLSLWEKRDAPARALSGGMKRRVLIAKALAHDPKILFLDEPSAGVDVELRKDMWEVVRDLQRAGTTIVLTTHYIEEAEEMADRVAVINHGRILLVEDKDTLMARMGQKELCLDLDTPLDALPAALADTELVLAPGGTRLVLTYNGQAERPPVAQMLARLSAEGIEVHDISTRQSSLEEIFVTLVSDRGETGPEAAA